MVDLPSLDGFILAAAALLIVSMGILRGISKASRPEKAPKPKPTPPKSKEADTARAIIQAQADKDQAKIDDASGDGQKLSDLVNNRRRKR